MSAEEVDRLTKELEAERAKNRKHDETSKVLDNIMKKLRVDVGESAKKLEIEKEKSTRLASIVDRLEADLAEAQATEDAHKAYSQDVADLGSQLDEEKAKCAHLKQELSQLRSTSKDESYAMQKEIDSLSHTVSTLRLQLAEAREGRENVTHSLREAQLAGEIAEAQEHARLENEHLKLQIESQKWKMDALARELDIAKEQADVLRKNTGGSARAQPARRPQPSSSDPLKQPPQTALPVAYSFSVVIVLLFLRMLLTTIGLM